MPALPLPTLPAGVVAIDSHCHMDEDRFDGDRVGAIERARAAGVETLITIGASRGMPTNHAAVALADENPAIFATVGIHPHEAAEVTVEVIDAIRELARHPRVVGIGETGLDYYYDNSPRLDQQRVFRQFIGLARELDLPLSIHLRDAYDDAVRILREEGADNVGGVIHCFSGDRRWARELLDLDFDLSFSGVVTFKNADELRAVVHMVPQERYLIETDAPFLAPVPMRGKRNEPAFVLYTAAVMAAVRSVPVDEVVAAATANTRRRFRLP